MTGQNITYVVMRDCCTSGNCFTCTRITPFGVPRKVEQFSTQDKNKAEEVANNWRQYNATVKEY